MFWLEEVFAPEDLAWHETLRRQCSTPIAWGEVAVSQTEWVPLVANRWIDFMRMHISACGGLNMGRKVAAMCEFFGVRTAWHGPGNVSPVGHAVNTHIDFAVPNFGCGEGAPFSATVAGDFPGLSRAQERHDLFERSAWAGHRHRREGGGEVCAHDSRHRSRCALLRWHTLQAVGEWPPRGRGSMDSLSSKREHYLKRLLSTHLRSGELRRYVELPAHLHGRSILDIGAGTSTTSMDFIESGARFIALDLRFRNVDEVRTSSGDYFKCYKTNLDDPALRQRNPMLQSVYRGR